MDLLSLFDVGVVLRDTAEGEFVHEIDLIGGLHMFILRAQNTSLSTNTIRKNKTHLEVLYDQRESSTKEHDLPILGQIG